ncbi:GNAT family N-acetyltransferase [Streptosporangium soli]|nr:GNAT family N-acetyltransferase [Streptosporangium sp. KLBMP 9127]
MIGNDMLELRQVVHPQEIDTELAGELVACWIAVSNAGGAAGFPFPPVDAAQVRPVADRIIADLAPERSRLVLGFVDGVLAGWLNIRRDVNPLIAHWGTVHHVQSRTDFRGRGIGSTLMTEARKIARDEMGLEQLHLAARAGVGLEDFYAGLGWKEIGRWPGALRLAPDDDRDEVLMLLAPL